MEQRKYPNLKDNLGPLTRPISFVVVHYCDDYFHNILKSQCVKNPFNQLITIDNRNNIFFDNLSQAINEGIDQAIHELIVIVHEDVLLVPGWQARFESSLSELEKVSPDWGMLGAVGWDKAGTPLGHWSDPFKYKNTLDKVPYVSVERLDEQLMILRKSSGIRLDDCLPSIHNIGHDLASTLKARSIKTFAIDAPTIHKYAGSQGELILKREDSPKINSRFTMPYLADKIESDEYLFSKWPEWRPDEFRPVKLNRAQTFKCSHEAIERPIIFLSCNEAGTKYFSNFAKNVGIFLGDSQPDKLKLTEFTLAIYRGVLSKFLHRAKHQKNDIVPRIRLAAAQLIDEGKPENLWGFNVPESMYLLPEFEQVFEEAVYVHILQDPLTSCLNAPRKTARYDNAIGRATLPQGYKYNNSDVTQSLGHEPQIHAAHAIIHQIETVRKFAKSHLAGRYREVTFENIGEKQTEINTSLCNWLGAKNFTSTQNNDREIVAGTQSSEQHPQEVIEKLTEILAPLRNELGYL